MITELFRIKNTRTGLYSKGGQWPTWSKNGKIWKRRGDLSNHFAVVNKNRYEKDIDDLVVETVVISETITENAPLSTFLQQSTERKERREQESKDRWDRYHAQQRRVEFERLKKEFEPSSK